MLFLAHNTYIQNGDTYNFRNWNNYTAGICLLRVQSNTSEFRSMYYPTYPLTIANNLEGVSSNDDFELTWQTPPISQNWQFGTIYNAFIFQDPLNDRYTATVPDPLPALGTTWWFQKWEDGSTSNIKSNIQATSPITYTAYYKGHLRSDNNNAFSKGSQRKLIRTENGIYHLIYESMGTTWYSYSLTDDFNGLWSDEEKLWCINASIDFEGNIVKIVAESGDEQGIILLTYEPDIYNHYFNSDYEVVATIDQAYLGNAKPVIAYNYQKIFIAYRKNNTDAIYQRTKYNYSNNWYWKNEEVLQNTTRYSVNPSVSGFNEYIFIAYQENNTINYMFGSWMGSPANYWNYNYYTTLSTEAVSETIIILVSVV